jgi:hypothetical protein
MIKNFIIFGLFLALAISINFPITEPAAPVAETKECVKEPYEQNQVIGGCVMQKASGRWIRTCG